MSLLLAPPLRIMPTFLSACCVLLAVLVAVLAAFVGWVSTTWLPEGVMFASLIPMTGGMPPPPLWGPWATPLTPPIPDDLTSQPRPRGEMFLTLPGGGQMPANGLGMCCRPSAYDDETVRRSVLWYLLQGGRHIDTAQLYLNHKPIGVCVCVRARARTRVFVASAGASRRQLVREAHASRAHAHLRAHGQPQERPLLRPLPRAFRAPRSG